MNPMTGNTDTLTNYLADSGGAEFTSHDYGRPGARPNVHYVCRSQLLPLCRCAQLYFCMCTQEPGFRLESWYCVARHQYDLAWHGWTGRTQRSVSITASGRITQISARRYLLLVGLKDDYSHDGRALFEDLYSWAIPQSLRAHSATLISTGPGLQADRCLCRAICADNSGRLHQSIREQCLRRHYLHHTRKRADINWQSA